jgi:hypothetical protein
MLMYQRQIFPPYSSSVRSDCVSVLRLIYLGVVRTLSYCNMIARNIGRTPSDLFVIVLEALAQCLWFLLWVLVGNCGPCVGYLYVYGLCV